MINVTTEFDTYIQTLVRKLDILWTVQLSNGVTIYSDFDRYPENPWDRMIKYCRENNVHPVKVKNLMFGAPQVVMAEDPNGLDGFFIFRGSEKDIELDSGEGISISYKKLVVGVLNRETNLVDVKRFCWPENQLEPTFERRLLTELNLSSMYFKDAEEKNRQMSLLVTDDRRAV